MTARGIVWPKKTRELHNHHFDSTVWNGFAFRDDDIVIATYAKSGTTWMQQIVSQLIFEGKEGLPVDSMSPWLDLRVLPRHVRLAKAEAQSHRRVLRTHLPIDALVFSPEAKYIFVARDGRDIVWSLYHHHRTANSLWYTALNDTPGRAGPPLGPPADTVVEYFRDWLEGDGFPFWPFWDTVRTWWEVRNLPNVTMVHYGMLKKDLPGEIRRIAAFLDIPIDEALFDSILDHCSFDYMKEHADMIVPEGGIFWEGGARGFINKGYNGRWRGVLPPELSAAYEARALEELGPECAAWIFGDDLD